ncbi:MAG: nucleotidyl transferase AbiEii/AbiGii toxin family protein [Chloroflexia bacterium]
MIDRYPASFANITTWARANHIPVAEARKRFAQYAVLRAVTGSRTLSELLVFKGGNALDFIWQPNRSTTDLDFSADMTMLADDWDPDILIEQFRVPLIPALDAVGRTLGVRLRLQKFVKQPPTGRKFATYAASIAYALADEQRNRERIERGEPIAATSPLEISLNEPICADERIDLHGTFRLRVSTLEDIVAEKLRALLQQVLRNRTRRQDLLDIAVILKSGQPLDPTRIAEYLQRKAAARNIPVSRAAFRDPALAERAQQDYAALAARREPSSSPPTKRCD